MPAPDFTGAFRQALSSGRVPMGVTARSPDEVARRFSVYRNNVSHGLSAALSARFPVVERLVGAEFFRALAEHYLWHEPPSSPVLLHWGQGFADFIAEFPPLVDLPYLPDVARLEWLCGQAYHAADARPLPAEALIEGSRAPEQFRAALHPSVAILASGHAVVTIWQANRPGAAPTEIRSDRPEIALVLRDPADRVAVMAISDGDAAFIRTLRAGETLLQAALSARRIDPAHDAALILGQLVGRGALVDAASKEFIPCP